MLDNIIIGVDGRTGGRDAIALAAALAEPQARLTLAFVHGDQATPEEAERLLLQERAAADIDGELACVREHSVGRALHDLAVLQRANLLVVGSCRHGHLRRALLGDDTRDSLNGARCPVAIAPPGYRTQDTPMTDIGVGYDFTPPSDAALAVARHVAARHHATVTACYVLEPPVEGSAGATYGFPDDSLDEIRDERRNRAQERLAHLEGVVGTARFGDAPEELAILSAGFGLLVVGSRGLGLARRVGLGSTSNRLLGCCSCPLLVVPGSSHRVTDSEAPDLAMQHSSRS